MAILLSFGVVNVRGSFLMTKYALLEMKKRNYGRILLVASIAGKEVYSCSDVIVIVYIIILQQRNCTYCSKSMSVFMFS